MNKKELIERKANADNMGVDTILKYHQGYIDICKDLGICSNADYNKTDITLYIINGLRNTYRDKYINALDDVIYYYVCKGDMRAVNIIVNEVLEKL